MTSPDPLAVGAMIAYCGWDPTEYFVNLAVTLDGNGTSTLALPSLKVTGVSSVIVTDGYGSVFTYLSTDSPASIGPGETMVSWSEHGILTCSDPDLAGAWPDGQGNVVVTYSSGTGTEDLALTAAVAHLSNRIATMGATSAKMGTASLAYGAATATGGMLLIEQMVFDKYRIPRVR